MTNHAIFGRLRTKRVVRGDDVIEAVDPNKDERDPDDASDDVRHGLSLLDALVPGACDGPTVA